MEIDRKELEAFYRTICEPSFEKDEGTFLISLAARKKYVREGEVIRLNRHAEMMAREYINKNDIGEFIAKINRVYATENSYLDQDGRPIPDHLKVVYVTVNPTSMIQAYSMFTESLGAYNISLLSGKRQEVSPGAIPSLWYSAIQNGSRRKNWIDIDLDMEDGMKKEEFVLMLKNVLSGIPGMVEHHMVGTQGGIHLLVKNEGFSRELNPPVILDILERKLSAECSEIKVNENNLIPCPGTLQNGKVVTFV